MNNRLGLFDLPSSLGGKLEISEPPSFKLTKAPAVLAREVERNFRLVYVFIDHSFDEIIIPLYTYHV